MKNPTQDLLTIARLLFEVCAVVELRALGVPAGGDWTATYSGYFNDLDQLAREAQRLDKKGARGVYVTPNPVLPALLARRKNTAKRCRKRDPLTKNSEVQCRRWLLIDVDPVRPAGISSTDAELKVAGERAREVQAFLKDRGWPDPLLASSGNGAHLMCRVDLPADDGGLIKRVLEALDARFSDDAVTVDTTVHNAARIWKLYGTMARKGDPTEDRPHRRARIIEVPGSLEVVRRAKLNALAAEAETGEEPPVGTGTGERRTNGRASHGDLTPEEVRGMLSAIPPRPDYGDWFKITAAVLDAVGGDLRAAEDLLKDWSKEEEEGEYRKILESDLDGSITAGTLVHQAREHGYEPAPRRRASRERSSRANATSAGKSAGSTPPVAGVLASDIERKPIQWLWRGRLARGEMTILDGDPGLGKSTLLCDLTARITTDRPMPGEDAPPPKDDPSEEPGGVVLVTTEDSPSHTIRPRLDAAGADASRVRIVQMVPTQDDDGGWNGPERVPILPNDLPLLKAAAQDVNASLIIIDPLFAHLSGEVNSFKDSDVRSALAPLSTFAEEAGCAVVVVRHLNKSTGGSSLYRGGGSIGIIGAARLAYAFGRDPDDDDRLVLAPNKINLGKKPPALALRLTSCPEVGEVARVEWLSTSECTAQDLFSAAPKAQTSPALDEAKDFLRRYLGSGPKPAAEAYDAAEEAGIKKDTLKRARREIATVEKTGGFGGGGYWQWTLNTSKVEDGGGLYGGHTSNGTTLRGEPGENQPKNESKSSFQADRPKNGMPAGETPGSPKNGTDENRDGAGQEWPSEASAPKRGMAGDTTHSSAALEGPLSGDGAAEEATWEDI